MTTQRIAGPMILYMIIATSSGCGFAIDPNSVSTPQGGIGAVLPSAARLPRTPC